MLVVVTGEAIGGTFASIKFEIVAWCKPTAGRGVYRHGAALGGGRRHPLAFST